MTERPAPTQADLEYLRANPEMRDKFAAHFGEDALPKEERSWAQVPGEALSNIGSSAYNNAAALVQPILHPIDTAKSIGRLGAGVVQKATTGGKYEKYADAAWEALKDRYGGEEQLKKTIATDPVGVLADASMFFSGGGTIAARLPGQLARAGELAAAAGRTIDPLYIAGRGAGVVGRGVGTVLAAPSGTYGLPIAENVRLGYGAGVPGLPGPTAAQNRVFTDNMRAPSGSGLLAEVARDAVNATRNMDEAASQNYVRRIGATLAGEAELPFDRIHQAIQNSDNVGRFEGRPLNPAMGPLRAQVGTVVSDYRSNPNPAFRTAEGFDALKKELNNIAERQTYRTPERRFAEDIARSVRETLEQNVPGYANVMGDYRAARNATNEMEQTLSTGRNARPDTTLRKLQSITRNNANSNFGHREALVRELSQHGAPDLIPALAGQSFNSWTPRGVGGAVTTAGMAPQFINTAVNAAHGAAVLDPLTLSGMALTAGLAIPRVVGEATNAGARAAGLVGRPLASAADWLGNNYIPPHGLLAADYLAGRVSHTPEGYPYIQQ